jgi:DNA-binding NarL/FixJ family response regulator
VIKSAHGSDALSRQAARAPRNSPIRLAFVDDHPTLLHGLSALFSADSRYLLAATGTLAGDIESLARAGSCDVIVADLGLKGDVFAALAAAAGLDPGPRLVVFTAHENVSLALRALNAGAHAFVLKGSPPEELHEAIAAVLRGELYVSPTFSPQVLAGFQKAGREGMRFRLSGRERQLVESLLKGWSNKEIATALGLTEKTVKHYMTNLMVKLQVHSRLEVVVAAQQWADGQTGAVPPAPPLRSSP